MTKRLLFAKTALAAMTIASSARAHGEAADPAPTPTAAPTSTSTATSTTTPLPPETYGPPPEERDEGRDLVAAYNVGFHWGISPGVFIPTSGGGVGFSIVGDFRYGFDTGSVIIAPGLRVVGIFPPNSKGVLGYAMTRFTFPISRFAPYVEGGAGPGYLGSDGASASYTGLALFGGGGALYYFSEHFGLGAGASYEKLLGSPLSFFSVGPILHIAF